MDWKQWFENFQENLREIDWKEKIEDFWDKVRDHGYYLLGIAILILIPSIIGAPAADLPQPFSVLNGFFNGSRLPVISDIYAIGREMGLFGTNRFVLSILILCLIWAIFAASWDLLSGYTGQISFGHALFWGLTAYVSYWASAGMLVSPEFESLLGSEFVLDPFSALIFGAIISALLAACIGVIALRIKGPYLALITLILPLISKEIIKLFSEFYLIVFYDVPTGKDFGLPFPKLIIPSVSKEHLNWKEINYLNFYIFALLIFFISVSAIIWLAFSRFGLIFQAIREDEEAAESLGINLRLYKILAFSFSAFFAGIAGGLYLQSLPSVAPSFFDSSFSFTVIIQCVIGGVGTITGGIIGAFLLTILVNLFLNFVFQDIHALDILAYGLLLVITLRYMRYGIVRAKKEEKRAIVLGIIFALFWAITDNINIFDYLKIEEASTFITLFIMLLFSIPAIPVFLVSEIIGFFVLEDVLGMSLANEALIKAKFLIYSSIGIPYAYYLPKIFKKARLRFWGVWPSVGRYEPD